MSHPAVPPSNKRLDILASYCRTAAPYVVQTPNITLTSLAAMYNNVAVQDLLNVNLHLATLGPNQFIELDEYIFIPPCTAGVPPPPVPTAACGYDFHVQLSATGSLVASSPAPYPAPAATTPVRKRRQLLQGGATG